METMTFKKNQRIEVLDRKGVWWPGVVTQVLENDGYIVNLDDGGEFRLLGPCLGQDQSGLSLS